METMSTYMTNIKSMAYLPKFNEFGNLETIVLENEGYYEVAMKPYDLMDRTLRYFGTSMRAAKESVKDFLGNINMAPVAIQSLYQFVWLPTKALKDETCAWINVFAIVNFRSINENMCEVLLLNGHTIELDMPLKKLLKQLVQAYAVMAIHYIRHEHVGHTYRYSQKPIHCKLNRNRYDYAILKKEEQ